MFVDVENTQPLHDLIYVLDDYKAMFSTGSLRMIKIKLRYNPKKAFSAQKPFRH